MKPGDAYAEGVVGSQDTPGGFGSGNRNCGGRSQGAFQKASTSLVYHERSFQGRNLFGLSIGRLSPILLAFYQGMGVIPSQAQRKQGIAINSLFSTETLP
jgi:hypothetical protein